MTTDFRPRKVSAPVSRILYVATSDIHLQTFHVPYLEWLAAGGHTVDIAAERRGGLSFDCVNQAYWLQFPRTLASFQNLRTLWRLQEIIKEGQYDLIHCHTPIPSALTRIAGRNCRKRGGKLLYTAHGFHFYRDGPLRNWLTYYPVEWLLSSLTDAVVTINHEDFGYVNGKMWHRESFLIPGIGVQSERFQMLTEEQNARQRAALGFPSDAFLVLYIAEFTRGKNHLFLVAAAEKLVLAIPKIKILLAGRGQLLDDVKEEVDKRGLGQCVEFLGFRSDVERFAAISDVGVSTSQREGLGIGLLEQMMCGVPVVASENKGHREFVQHGSTGFLFPQGDCVAFVQSVVSLYRDAGLRTQMGEAARAKAEEFSVRHSLKKMQEIYAAFLDRNLGSTDTRI